MNSPPQKVYVQSSWMQIKTRSPCCQLSSLSLFSRQSCSRISSYQTKLLHQKTIMDPNRNQQSRVLRSDLRGWRGWWGRRGLTSCLRRRWRPPRWARWRSWSSSGRRWARWGRWAAGRPTRWGKRAYSCLISDLGSLIQRKSERVLNDFSTQLSLIQFLVSRMSLSYF